MAGLNRAMTREQLDEHRLEIENRIRNLFWTVSGDYSLEISPDIYDFGRSRFIPMYDAIKQGAFARHFDAEALGMYLLKKVAMSAEEQPLTELAQLCIETAVYPIIRQERKGVDEIRTQAFRDILAAETGDEKDLFRQVKNVMMRQALGEESTGPISAKAEQILERMAHLQEAATTDEIIEGIDEIYNTIYDPGFETRQGNLHAVMSQDEARLLSVLDREFLDDESMEDALKRALKTLRRDMMRMEVPAERRKTKGLTAAKLQNISFAKLSAEEGQKVRDYVDLSFGKSFLHENEQRALNARLCRGIHHGCQIHWTDGILHAPVKKNNQYRYAEMHTSKNQMYYYMNNRAVRKNIRELGDMLSKLLARKTEREVWRDRSGALVPARLWRLGRSQDEKLFDKTAPESEGGFVVDILLDASGSQLKRQGQVAVQGYIISEALTMAGIPHRVSSFCTFWDYTILHRFRDYDDKKDQNQRLFEYTASANNRDGLAMRAVVDGLNQRQENHKIMIVLSDGRPNDLGRSSNEKRESVAYVGEEAIRDTAFEVRRARQLGISVLGIFAGSADDLATEKRIFGRDFAYIRKLDNFAPVVGNYLCRQIDEE